MIAGTQAGVEIVAEEEPRRIWRRRDLIADALLIGTHALPAIEKIARRSLRQCGSDYPRRRHSIENVDTGMGEFYRRLWGDGA